MADYEASAGLIGRLKSGQALVVQAVDSRGQPISLSLPLADFAEAYRGPPPKDAKAFDALKEQLPEWDIEGPGELPLRVKKGTELIYSSPWTKFCPTPQAGKICFTGKDGRVGLVGPAMIAAVLIEPESGAKRILRVTLPLGMQMPRGTRLIVDGSAPMTAPYTICFTNGCIADHEASDKLIGRSRSGKRLTVQGINRGASR